MSRVDLDFYPTPEFYNICLWHWLHKEGIAIHEALEPFAGDGAIVRSNHAINWVTNDIEKHSPDFTPGTAYDLSLLENWGHFDDTEAIITNIPYYLAGDNFILQEMITKPKILTALLFRQNWLNPSSSKKGYNDRAKLLEKYPISALLTMPRIPMAVNSKTGKPQTDSCNHAWFIWLKNHTPKQQIVSYSSLSVPGWKGW